MDYFLINGLLAPKRAVNLIGPPPITVGEPVGRLMDDALLFDVLVVDIFKRSFTCFGKS